ncbi:MAG TPA: hypothetical protein VEW93_05365 [Acidimicrobiales bacterium]|nr:hypothetical protein [Acidimicrobiales bacterium]
MAAADSGALSATRRTLHVVAEHVLMPDFHDRTCRIGLRPAAGGFATPPYAHPEGFTRRLRVDGTDVVDERDGRSVTRVPLTTPATLGAVRSALGITAEAPADIYDLGSDGTPTQRLLVDPASTAVVADLFAATDEALTALRAEAEAEPGRAGPDEGIGSIQLWPEHFDVACSIDEVTFGASPGDDDHPEPYLYVAPWEDPRRGGFGNEPFGASRPALPVPSATEALIWFRHTRAAAMAR